MLNLNKLSIGQLKDIFQVATNYDVKSFGEELYINGQVLVDSHFNVTNVSPLHKVNETWLKLNNLKQVNNIFVQPTEQAHNVSGLLDNVNSVLNYLSHVA